MNKLYTLQECYEMLGCAFPFTVDFTESGDTRTVTFRSRIEQAPGFSVQWRWICDTEMAFIYRANERAFDPSRQKYINDLKDVLK